MLKYYFETLFDNNMNWNNQSIYWQIDHRIPISWFNLENDEELKFACNYNLWKRVQISINHTIIQIIIYLTTPSILEIPLENTLQLFFLAFLL